MSEEIAAVYSVEELHRELRQGEIISNIIQYLFDPITNGAFATTIDYAIILSQDCDLLRDFDDRSANGTSALNGVLLYELEPAAQGRAKRSLNNNLWRPISSNGSDRYHYFQEVPPICDLEGAGLPDLLLDFRRYFTIPSA